MHLHLLQLLIIRIAQRLLLQQGSELLAVERGVEGGGGVCGAGGEGRGQGRVRRGEASVERDAAARGSSPISPGRRGRHQQAPNSGRPEPACAKRQPAASAAGAHPRRSPRAPPGRPAPPPWTRPPPGARSSPPRAAGACGQEQGENGLHERCCVQARQRLRRLQAAQPRSHTPRRPVSMCPPNPKVPPKCPPLNTPQTARALVRGLLHVRLDLGGLLVAQAHERPELARVGLQGVGEGAVAQQALLEEDAAGRGGVQGGIGRGRV